MTKLKFTSLILFLLALGGCGGGILSPHGPIAAAQKNLILVSFFVMLIVIIPVLVITVLLSLRYRENNKSAIYAPEWHHNLKLEIFWWAIPIIIIIFLSFKTWQSSHDLDPYRPFDHQKTPIKVQVISLNWKWLFIYPDYGVATINYMPIPIDTPINLAITSDGPMNSFWIPQIAGQIYSMTGMATKLHIMGSKIGEYKGLSANYSGVGFEGMKFVAKVTSVEEFEEWVEAAKTSNLTKILDIATYNDLIINSVNHPIETYLVKDKNIFQDSMMKYMGNHAGHGQMIPGIEDASKMDHSKMDHSKMDHSKMDHSKMDIDQPKKAQTNLENPKKINNNNSKTPTPLDVHLDHGPMKGDEEAQIQSLNDDQIEDNNSEANKELQAIKGEISESSRKKQQLQQKKTSVNSDYSGDIQQNRND
ncbi:Cytochrome o ubiquinol oxidase subunit II [Candidatus Hepatincolaceae symbiont of Richtersius coronifer]